jgi:hypothetical protein
MSRYKNILCDWAKRGHWRELIEGTLCRDRAPAPHNVSNRIRVNIHIGGPGGVPRMRGPAHEAVP